MELNRGTSGSGQFEIAPPADRRVVFDILDHLRRAYDEFINTYHEDVPFLDGFMGVHNFHKLVIQDIARRAKIEGEERRLFFKMAADTFSKAMAAEK